MITDPWRFKRPDAAHHYISLLADAPRRPLALFGPRQIGKTHFVTHDLTEAAAAKGWDHLYVDLWGQADPLGAINTALGTALRALQTRTGRTPVTSVGALGVNVGMAAPAPLVLPSDPAAQLATAFAELRRLQPDQPVLLMLDEAQTLGRSGAGDAAMKAIRALFNSHPGGLMLLFTGSSKSQLVSLVGDHSKTAFKLAAHIDFPALGISFVAFVAERIKAISGRDVAVAELGWAFSQLLHRPGEMIDFARFLVTETPGATVAEAMQAFKLRNRPDVGFEVQFEECTPLQRGVLLQVARGAKLFSKDAREAVSRYMGETSAVAPASVHHALAQLEGKGVLSKREGRGRYDFEDEHLRTWLQEVAAR